MRAVTHSDDPGRAAAYWSRATRRDFDTDARYDRDVADAEAEDLQEDE